MFSGGLAQVGVLLQSHLALGAQRNPLASIYHPLAHSACGMRKCIWISVSCLVGIVELVAENPSSLFGCSVPQDGAICILGSLRLREGRIAISLSIYVFHLFEPRGSIWKGRSPHCVQLGTFFPLRLGFFLWNKPICVFVRSTLLEGGIVKGLVPSSWIDSIAFGCPLEFEICSSSNLSEV